MKYKGIELKEFESEKPVVFDPPKRMLVWDYDETPTEVEVLAFIPNRYQKVIEQMYVYTHCAEIPKVPELELVTYRELARWLAEGNGEVKDENDEGTICMSRFYWEGQENNAVEDSIHVRKWDDTEWNQPTREYIGLEDK